MPNLNLMPGELLIKKSEHDINQSVNRFSDSLNELAEKLERPMQKVQGLKQNLSKVQQAPWGLIGAASAFTIGFLIMRKRRIH